MKNFLMIILISFILITPLEAQKINCTEISQLAASIMEERQKGRTLEYMLARAQGNPGVEELIRAAYREASIFIDPVAKERAVKDFTANVYGDCWRKTKK